jgi:hypothetical protein
MIAYHDTYRTDHDAEDLGDRSQWDADINATAPLFSQFRYLRDTTVSKELGHATFLATQPTLAELSVSMKHWEAWKRMVENKIPVALIIEDDAMFEGDERVDLPPLVYEANFCVSSGLHQAVHSIPKPTSTQRLGHSLPR